MTKILTEKEAEDFLEKENFPIVKRKIAKNKKEILSYAKEIGFPVVLKNPTLLHKTEKNAVKINITEKNIEKAYEELKKTKPSSILIQKYIKGSEILIGLKKDPSFSHVIAFGLGGIYSEILKDVSFRICPITKKDAAAMIKEIKGYQLLKGARGRKPVNIKLIENILIKISNLAKKYPNIRELDINPFMVDEKNAKIVDARIIFD